VKGRYPFLNSQFCIHNSDGPHPGGGPHPGAFGATPLPLRRERGYRGTTVVNIVDLSAEHFLDVLGRYPISGYASVNLVDSYLYVAGSECGLLILDVSVPESPVKIGRLDLEVDYNGQVPHAAAWARR
jgi:hypothetical protein